MGGVGEALMMAGAANTATAANVAETAAGAATMGEGLGVSEFFGSMMEAAGNAGGIAPAIPGAELGAGAAAANVAETAAAGLPETAAAGASWYDGPKAMLGKMWDNAKNAAGSFVARDAAGNIDGWGTAGNIGYAAAGKTTEHALNSEAPQLAPLPDPPAPPEARAEQLDAAAELNRLRSHLQ